MGSSDVVPFQIYLQRNPISSKYESANQNHKQPLVIGIISWLLVLTIPDHGSWIGEVTTFGNSLNYLEQTLPQAKRHKPLLVQLLSSTCSSTSTTSPDSFFCHGQFSQFYQTQKHKCSTNWFACLVCCTVHKFDSKPAKLIIIPTNMI